MKYTATIKSFVDQQKTYKLGYSNKDDYLIIELKLVYAYNSMTTPSMVVLVGDNVNYDKQSLIGKGDLIQFFEDGVMKFFGYVLKNNYSYSANGAFFTIEFDTLLSSLTRQPMVESSKDVVSTLIPLKTNIVNTALFSSKLPLQTLLDFMFKESVIDFAKNSYGYLESASAYQIIYEDTNLLSPNTVVWYYPGSVNKKSTILEATIFPFQHLLYQNFNGDIVFALPSFSDSSGLSIHEGSSNLISVECNQEWTDNYLVSTLIFPGWFPPEDPNNTNVVAGSKPDPKYFPREAALANSPYFKQTYLDIHSFNTSILNDPALLNVLTYITLSQGNEFSVPFFTPFNAFKPETIVPLFSNRMLASALSASNTLTLRIQRDVFTDIPIGKTFLFNNTKWFCVAAVIDLNISGVRVTNTLTLMGVPLKSITGIWRP